MTAMDIDTSVLEQLDFEFEPPCEVKGCDPRPADYLVVFACCGYNMMFCDPDLQRVLEWARGGGDCHCDICGKYGIKGNPFALIEKLKQ